MVAKKKASKTVSVKDYEKMGRMLESIYEGGYITHRRIYQINFLRGLFFGFGSVLGGTILIAVLIWFLSFFSEIPIIGNFIDTIETTIEQ